MTIDPDWRRISRWCFLGTFVMLIWLMAPVAKCSWQAFRDTPIGEVTDDAAPAGADQERLAQGAGFFDRWGAAIRVCYARTPLTGQEPWKHYLLFGFAGVMIVSWALARNQARSKRTFERD